MQKKNYVSPTDNFYQLTAFKSYKLASNSVCFLHADLNISLDQVQLVGPTYTEIGLLCTPSSWGSNP